MPDESKIESANEFTQTLPFDQAYNELFQEGLRVYGHGAPNEDAAQNILRVGLMPKAGGANIHETTYSLEGTPEEVLEHLTNWGHHNLNHIALLAFPLLPSGSGRLTRANDFWQAPEEVVTGYEQSTMPPQFVYGYFDKTRNCVVINPGFDPHYVPESANKPKTLEDLLQTIKRSDSLPPIPQPPVNQGNRRDLTLGDEVW
jgi:hypothetical protein